VIKEEAKDLEGEKVGMTDDQLSKDEVKSAKTLVQAFLQTVKGYRLYDSSHPILLKYMERLTKNFARYFEELPSFSLQIGDHQLFYHGNVVYESDDVKESLAFVFFRDGIRELRFHRGLRIEELLDFLTVIRRSDAINRKEDDLVTLLWEKDFSHITFTTMDEFLEKSSTFVPATEQDLLEDGVQKQASRRRSVADQAGLECPMKTNGPEPCRQSLVDACQLTPNELNGSIARFRKNTNRAPGHMIDSLVEIFSTWRRHGCLENMISFFEAHQRFLNKEIGKAAGCCSDSRP
jgi:hypothetical protein